MRHVYISLIVFCFGLPGLAAAHDTGSHTAKAHYIANEGVLISQGETKIMFDPLPLSGFGMYMDVSETQKAQMMAGEAPYDSIDAVFISHAHRDHFSATDMIAYMTAQSDVKLVAPEQAVAMMRADKGWYNGLIPRITTINLGFMDPPKTVTIGNITASAVHIPHSGWPNPERAKVQNMVFRVTLDTGATVIHMGDADVRPQHYTPYKAHWNAKRTDMAFPPYWFFLYPGGDDILYKQMNIETAVGTHVPLDTPEDLKESGADYFSERGEERDITLVVKPLPPE